MPLISIQNLEKTYTIGEVAVHALRGVSLAIEPGEFVSIVGPSGSGKSTFMHILGCLDRPDAGTYLLDGRDVSTLSRDELARVRNTKIGFVFQSFNLLSRTSAIENVELPLVYAGVPARERRRRAASALDKVGLGKRMDHHPSQLSGGQQQRVAIARSIVCEPRLILADEPTGALDSESAAEVMVLMNELHRDGLTLVLVTHDPAVGAQAQRMIRMRDGSIVADGATTALASER